MNENSKQWDGEEVGISRFDPPSRGLLGKKTWRGLDEYDKYIFRVGGLIGGAEEVVLGPWHIV